MRTITFFLFLVSSSSLFAKSLTVKVIEGWKSTPVANAEVTLKSNVGQVLKVAKTDSLGTVVFKNLTYGYHTVVVASIADNFIGATYRLKLQKSDEIMLLLQPTRKYERHQLKLEDEKYSTMHRKKKVDTTETNIIIRDTIDTSPSPDTTEVWVSSEYPGGNAAMKEFIKSNLIYPEISRELGEQGRVYVQFIIETDGVLSHVSIFRSGISPEINREAKRLVRAMPNWTPGTVDGKPVRTRCRLPLTFILQ